MSPSRCLRICSKSTLLQSALSDLKNSLLQNRYPRGVINYNVNDLIHKHKDPPSQPTLIVPKKDGILVLPYLGLHSDAIVRRLKSCDRKTERFKALAQIGHASAVADHSISTGHNIKWDHFEILASGQCDLQCKIKETLLIRDLKPALNENVGSENFLVY